MGYRRWLLIGCAVLTVLNIAAALFSTDLVLLWINARAGCYPWSPKEVEFYQGMTLCPGQTARGTFNIELRAQRDPRI